MATTNKNANDMLEEFEMELWDYMNFELETCEDGCHTVDDDTNWDMCPAHKKMNDLALDFVKLAKSGHR